MNKHFLPSVTILAFTGTISVLNYTLSQTDRPVISDLTMANIECMGIPPDELPAVKLPCKHTGNENDCCIYNMVSADGTIIEGHQWFCINDPEY